MQTLGEIRPHMFRVLGMAKSRGVDLAAAKADGQITQADFANMVTTCRGCTDPEACARLMEQRRAVPFCPNADTFTRLAKG